MNRILKQLACLLLLYLHSPLFSHAEDQPVFTLQSTLKFKYHVSDIDFSPDGKTIAIGGFLDQIDELNETILSDGEIVFIETQSLKTKSTLKVPLSAPISLSFSPDQKLLAVGREYSDVVIYDFETHKYKQPIKGLDALVTFFPDSQKLIISDTYHQVSIWNNRKIIAKKTLDHDFDWGYCPIAISPDGKTIAIVRADYDRKPVYEIYICDSNTLETKATLKTNAKPVIDLRFSPTGDQLITGGADGIKVWDLKSMKEIKSLFVFKNKKMNYISTIKISSTGNLLAASSFEGTTIWNIDTFQLITTLPKSGPFVEFSPDAKTLLSTTKSDGATGGYNKIQVWKINNSRSNK